MSNYVAPAYDPETGTIRPANWLDNYFGRHRYGVQFGDYGKVWTPKEVEIPPDAEFVRKAALDAALADSAAVRAELQEARDVLSDMSSYVGAGLGDENTTVEQYDKRIRWGIEHLTNVARKL